jgi:hypothetical protein
MDDMLEAIRAEVTEHPPTAEVEAFFKLLKASEELLHEHIEVTHLAFITQLMAIKSNYIFSVNCCNDLMKLINDILLKPHKVHKDMYRSKKMMSALRLSGYILQTMLGIMILRRSMMTLMWFIKKKSCHPLSSLILVQDSRSATTPPDGLFTSTSPRVSRLSPCGVPSADSLPRARSRWGKMKRIKKKRGFKGSLSPTKNLK